MLSLQLALRSRQLGFFSRDDQKVLNKFLLNRFKEIVTQELLMDQTDHACQHLFSICENILNTLSKEGVDVREQAVLLAIEYERCQTQIPDYAVRKIYLKFHYFEATKIDHVAFNVLIHQNRLARSIFSETEMLDLMNCVCDKQNDYFYYNRALNFLANYYFRLTNTNPSYLINYALYLSEQALTGVNILSIGLNALLIRRFDTQELMALFPQWQFRINQQNNSVFIIQGQRVLELTDFIKTISAHAVVFATVAYESVYKPTEQCRLNRSDGSISATLRTLRIHLINCMQQIPTQGHVLSPDIHKLLCNLAEHPTDTVATCAKDILRECSIQPASENASTSTAPRM